MKYLLHLSFLVGVVVIGGGIGCAGCDSTPPDPPADGGVDCVVGTSGCPCGVDDVCGDDLVCTDGTCAACVFGSRGCPCAPEGCGDDVCDADTTLCRAPSACEQAGCAQHQLCEQSAGADAVCLDDCEDGYEFDVDACLPLPSCDVDAPGYCGVNRACTDGIDGAVCGDCDSGFVDVDGDCVDNSCAGLDCEGRQHRTCTDGDDGGVCGDCLDGYVEEAGTCVALVTCESLNCQAPLACVFASGSDTPSCEEPAVCPDQQVQNSSGTCVACTACFANGAARPGVVDVGNGSVAFGSSCICALEDNFFQGVDGVVRSCDADNDGWVNSRLLTALNLDGNSSNPFAANARCHVREIDRFELRGDDFRPEFVDVDGYDVAAQRTVLISALNLGVSTAKLYEPEETDDPAAFELRYRLSATPREKQLRSYGLGTNNDDVADHLRAAEVNPLTKACNDDRDDINLDGVADVTQIHGAFPQGTNGFGPDATPAAAVFYRFAYFVELAHSSFRDRTGTGVDNCNGAVPCRGALVIEEKHRVVDDVTDAFAFAINYGADADAQWQTCLRSRDFDYPGASSNIAQNSDFAEWSDGCTTAAGGCFVGSGNASHVAYDGRAIDVNRAITGVPAETNAGVPRFVGMNHASQFKCASLTATNGPRAKPTPSTFNDCRLAATRHDNTGTVNPTAVTLACTTTTAPTGNAAASRNAWYAVTHQEYDDAVGYKRGCISEGTEWGDLLCVVDANTPPDNQFGGLFCGCGDHRAGLDCEISCAPQQVLQNRTPNATTGEINGYFACMIPVASSGETLSGGGFTLRGAVPAASGPVGVHTGGGFTLTPGTTP